MRRVRAEHAALAVAALALALRLVDPLGNPVLAAEDPLIHVYRAERLDTKGVWPWEYPPGFPGLMVAAKALGLPLMELARLAPPLLGAAATLAMFALARRLGGDVAGLGAALLYAAAPEMVRRTTLWAPTAHDMLLAPLLVWWLLDLAEGQAKAVAPLVVAGMWLYVAHPWGLAYLLLGLAPFCLLALLRAQRRWVRPAALGSLALALVPLALFFRKHFAAFTDRLEAWAAAPTLQWSPPRFTEPLDMLGVPLSALVLLGAARGPWAMRRIGLGWVVALLPLAVFDLTGLDYVPYRTVAFLLPGMVLLGGAAVAWTWSAWQGWAEMPRRWRTWGRAAGPLFAAVLVVGASAPAAAMEPWYRIHQQEEYEALAFAARPWTKTVTGSWPSGALATAMGHDARIDPEFFRDWRVRAQLADEAEPHAVLVVVDDAVRALASPETPERKRADLAFLGNATLVAEGGRVTVWAWRP
jgi:hypothetical protein